ncbi:MAG: S1C family serine protease [Halohasta sp.]
MNLTRRGVLAGLGVGVAGVAGCTVPTSSGRQQADTDYTQIYRRVVDSVVEIHVSDGEENRGQGSGFLVDGAIVTNHHVVDTGPDVSVQFSNREWADATVEGSDPHSDLAVLSVDDSDSVPASLSFVEQSPPVGEEVLAIGSPFDLSDSLSQGIISGRNRSIPGPDNYQIPDAIQTDTALNPGSSGGPMVDLSGEVVGVVTANQGETVGFAVSAALARRVVPELRENGSYEHSYLGITMTELTPELAEANDVSEPGGLLVIRVVPDSPADGVLQASVDADEESAEGNESSGGGELPGEEVPGEEPPDDEDDEQTEQLPTGGDVIVELAGEPVADSESLASVLALETRPGDEIPVTVIRDGDERTVELTLESRPTE